MRSARRPPRPSRQTARAQLQARALLDDLGDLLVQQGLAAVQADDLEVAGLAILQHLAHKRQGKLLPRVRADERREALPGHGAHPA